MFDNRNIRVIDTDAPTTRTDYAMVLRGLRAIERLAESAPYGGEVPDLPRDAWWRCMLAAATRVASAPDADERMQYDAATLRNDLHNYAGECDACESTGRITVVVQDDEGGYDGSAPCPTCRPA